MNLEVVKSCIYSQLEKNTQMKTLGIVLLVSVIDFFSSTESPKKATKCLALRRIRVPSVAQ